MTHAMVKGSNVPLDATAVRAVLRWTPGPGSRTWTPRRCCSASTGGCAPTRTSSSTTSRATRRAWCGGCRKKRVAEGLTDTVEADLAALDPASTRWCWPRRRTAARSATYVTCGILLYDAGRPTVSPLATFDVRPETGEETALICGELYRRGERLEVPRRGPGLLRPAWSGLATDFGISVDERRRPPPTRRRPRRSRPRARPSRCRRSSRPRRSAQQQPSYGYPVESADVRLRLSAPQPRAGLRYPQPGGASAACTAAARTAVGIAAAAVTRRTATEPAAAAAPAPDPCPAAADGAAVRRS